MSYINLTKTSAPSTPATDKVAIYMDTADNRVKAKDYTGAISSLTEDGSKDRNILTNGGFRIQQRVATASSAITGISTTTRAGQVADRWAVTTSVATNLNWAQIDTAGAVESGLNSRYYGSIISATAGKKVMLSQFIINSEMAHLRGQQVRVSVKTSQKVGSEGQTIKLGLLYLTSSGTVDVCPAFLTGAWSTTTGVDPAWGTNLSAIAPDSVTPENGTTNGSYLDITTSLAWKRSSAVFTIPTTAKNLCVVLFANATGGTTDNLSIAEFRMTQGSEIIDWVEMPLALELSRCQRFFSKSFPLTTVPAASLAVATAGNGSTGIIAKAGAVALAATINVTFPVRMWKTPTALTLFTPVGAGAVPYRINGTTPAVQTAAAQTGLMDYGAVVTATGDAAGVVGDLVGVHWTAEAEFIT